MPGTGGFRPISEEERGKMGEKLTRVKLTVQRKGAGEGPAWWAQFSPGDVIIEGRGSGRRVTIFRAATPQWLPKPDDSACWVSRADGMWFDGTAWVDLPPGAIIRAGATWASKTRCARVSSPVLIVEEGGLGRESPGRDAPYLCAR